MVRRVRKVATSASATPSEVARAAVIRDEAARRRPMDEAELAQVREWIALDYRRGATNLMGSHGPGLTVERLIATIDDLQRQLQTRTSPRWGDSILVHDNVVVSDDRFGRSYPAPKPQRKS